MFQILKKIFKSNLYDKGENNIVNYQDFPECEFFIQGNNNKVIIDPTTKLSGRIQIVGNDNFVHIGHQNTLNMTLNIGFAYNNFSEPTHSCILKISDGVYMHDTQIVLADDSTYVKIGRKCSFSKGCQICVVNLFDEKPENGKLLNTDSFVHIGDNVSCGSYVNILRNSSIPDKSVLEADTVVNSSFEEQNTLIVGNPARIVQHNIDWEKLSSRYCLQRQ
ncbi:MAG: hypothetical protein E7013_00220 [Alphaproteobacteria bacterium]|nr:hypothetical protein [Alphaproteobacteria bacterium]